GSPVGPRAATPTPTTAPAAAVSPSPAPSPATGAKAGKPPTTPYEGGSWSSSTGGTNMSHENEVPAVQRVAAALNAKLAKAREHLDDPNITGDTLRRIGIIEATILDVARDANLPLKEDAAGHWINEDALAP